MSKGLEALDFIKFDTQEVDCAGCLIYDEQFNIIEKKLKVLDIIKKKKVNVADEIFDMSNYTEYITYCSEESYADEYMLTQEEFDLLKELLNDE